MMNIWILAGLLICGTLPLMLQANSSVSQEQAYKEIHTEELKAWYNHNKQMIVVDARSKEYFDGTLLPKAIWLPFDVANIEEALPSRNELIVVYCWSPACPASQWMIDRLLKEGYTHVYKYPEGLHEWIQQGLPVNKK